MQNIKCADCAEYKNEWCEKVIDSPYPDMTRDCAYFHERDKDVVKVVRCKDCKWYIKGHDGVFGECGESRNNGTYWQETDYCSWGERREE